MAGSTLVSKTVTVIPAAPADLPEILALLATTNLPVADISATGDIEFLVARRDAQICGAVGLERYGRFGLLRSLVVDPGQRSKRLGRRLVGCLESTARAAGVDELWLLTTDADRYFEGLGFETRGRGEAPAAIAMTREFADLCPADSVLMQKKLKT